jgi:hypothetical protein
MFRFAQHDIVHYACGLYSDWKLRVIFWCLEPVIWRFRDRKNNGNECL